ncbi:MAG: hypothetical protein IJT01_10240, partial [Selenomonadaceae bacterium]|nr:hypothetical protein [Selenomonadaceae bacterium]
MPMVGNENKRMVEQSNISFPIYGTIDYAFLRGRPRFLGIGFGIGLDNPNASIFSNSGNNVCT